MPINPILFANKVGEDFRRYLLSAYPLTDPDLKQQMQDHLKKANPLESPLVKGPYVTLSEAFEEGDPLASLVQNGRMHPDLPELVGYPSLYRHQQQALEAVQARKHTLISTGTGSGKTEAFLIPIMDTLLHERDKGIDRGLSTILVYPMNALASDQLDRLRVLLAGTGITFGQWIGPTPKTNTDAEKRRIKRYEGNTRDGFLNKRKALIEDARLKEVAPIVLAPKEECISEEEIRVRNPRILITNYRQLEILITRWPDVGHFENAPLSYLVFDEAHTYRGAVGAETAVLIRRLRTLADRTPDDVICIGTSATLTDPEGEDSETSAARFASRFFGVDEHNVKLVGEQYVQRTWPPKRHRPTFPAGDPMQRLQDTLSTIAELQQQPSDKAIQKLANLVDDFTGQPFRTTLQTWREDLFELLLQNDYAHSATRILMYPELLKDAAQNVSNRVAPDREVVHEKLEAELLTYLVLGAAANRNGEPLLRPKVHIFQRGLDDVVGVLDQDDPFAKARLYLNREEADEKHPDRMQGAFFHVLTCRTCGQHLFEQHYPNLKIDTYANSNRLKALLDGDAGEDSDGKANAVWKASDTEGEGTRLVFTNRLLEEADEDDDDGASRKKHKEAFVCRFCGALHRHHSLRCQNDECERDDGLVKIIPFGELISSCPTCKKRAVTIGAKPIEPLRRMRAIHVADVHVLAQAMIMAAPKTEEKLVVFTDSRQDAAFQAGWMQDHARRIRLRHMMYEELQVADEPLSLADIAHRLYHKFIQNKRLVLTIFPELEDDSAEIIEPRRDVRIHTALKYMVIREFSAGIRQRDALETLGLAKVEYKNLDPAHPDVIAWAKQAELTPEQAVDAIALLLDVWRRNRIMHIEGENIYGRFHRKEDHWVRVGILPLGEGFHPTGIDLEPCEQARVRTLLTAKRTGGVQKAMAGWLSTTDSDAIDQAIRSLWTLMTKKLNLLAFVRLPKSGRNGAVDAYQVNGDSLIIHPHHERCRCTVCQRVMTRQAPDAKCLSYHCHGSVTMEEPDPDDYDTAMMGKPFRMVSAEEHTAQVPGELREVLEQEFKAREGRVNCLVATPTLELGVDIGGLDMVLMRNVPPLASNYWQRAGRAGREERMAVVVTYCRRNMHDQYFFKNPTAVLGGKVETPSFHLANPRMIQKHGHASILSSLHLRARRDDDVGNSIRDALKNLFPPFIVDVLYDAEVRTYNPVPDTNTLQGLVSKRRDDLTDVLSRIFGAFWPENAQAVVQSDLLEALIDSFGTDLRDTWKRIHKRLDWARQTRDAIQIQEQQKHIRRFSEEDQLRYRCNKFIDSVLSRSGSTYTLSVLGREGFLPGYGMYTEGVTAYANPYRYGTKGLTFELQRPAPVALREFAPGNRLYANRSAYHSYRFHLSPHTHVERAELVVNPAKEWVGVPQDLGMGSAENTTIVAIPIDDVDLAASSPITDEQETRFSMPVAVYGRRGKSHRGGIAYRVDSHDMAFFIGHELEHVNVGEASRVRQGELGYHICTVCGSVRSPYVVAKVLDKFISVHTDRCGRVPDPVALFARTDSDVLFLKGISSKSDAYNLGEALRIGARNLLDMDENDLQLMLLPQEDESYHVGIYDPMPGGSGLLEKMIARWEELIQAAINVLSQCPSGCEKACYTCMKTYRNQFYHTILNRHLACDLLEEWMNRPEKSTTIEPEYDLHEQQGGFPGNPSEEQLKHALEQNHFPAGEFRPRITLPDGSHTEPDWLYADPHNPNVKIAIYLDGMSPAIHGNRAQAMQDKIRRQKLVQMGYSVIEIQAVELNDSSAMQYHFDMFQAYRNQS